jgi:chromosomal replication initiation ATPase DnaA
MLSFYVARARRLLRARRVLHIVAWQHGVSVEQIISKNRAPYIDRARLAAMRAARVLFDQTAGQPSFRELAAVFRRDHAAVLKACKGFICHR